MIEWGPYIDDDDCLPENTRDSFLIPLPYWWYSSVRYDENCADCVLGVCVQKIKIVSENGDVGTLTEHSCQNELS